MAKKFDAIVVGARCAGSPTAMLLTRMGYEVLLLDKNRFPSDTISTHLVHPPGIAALKRWDLLERVVQTGCPPIDSYTFDLGPIALRGSPGIPDVPAAYAPRRTVLDKILLEAASEAGAEVREGFTVEDILVEDGRAVGISGREAGGPRVTERARVVIGADGLHSRVARSVNPEAYNEKTPFVAGYYSYWSGLPTDGFEAYDRGERSWAAWPTNDGLTLVIVGWPYAEFEANRGDIEGHYHRAFERAPAFAERMRGATRAERFYGMAVPSYFRKPFGPGWALVGDAGYNKDFITAQGISDAFRDAELCAGAVAASLSGKQPFDEAMSGYQRTRDEQVMAMFEFTCQFASFQPPTSQMEELYGAMQGNREAMDGFARVFAGATSPAEFFSEANIGRILEAAH